MSEFWIFFEKGLMHILDLSGYYYILFLVALTIPYAFKDWKKMVLLISLFTVGHTLALLVSVYGIVILKVTSIEFLIPITILFTAFFNLFIAGKSSKQESGSVIAFLILFFGIIHGLSFAGYFKTIIGDSVQSKLLPLLEFSLGVETAQLVVVVVVLILSYSVQTFFRFSKRDWVLVTSSFIIGVVLPLIIQSQIWKR